jgi:RNA polymerase sigma-70 factor (ECF subfamily)
MSDDFREELISLLPRLRRFAVTLTGDLDEADDLVQQACEKALIRREQWQSGSRLDSWMYRIIQNQHIDNRRRAGRRPQGSEGVEVADVPDGLGENVHEHRDMLRKAGAIMAELPEEQRAVMLLVAVEERSYREVSELLQIPVGTVMSRLYRARSRIMAQLHTERAHHGAIG